MNKLDKDYIKMQFVLILLVFAVFTCYNLYNNHVSLYPLCSIDIKSEGYRGERATIKEALNILRTEQPETYKIVCKNIDVINEKMCITGDTRGDASYTTPEVNGCYVRGTHTIYLKPNKENTMVVARARSEDIARYAGYARDFWKHR